MYKTWAHDAKTTASDDNDVLEGRCAEKAFLVRRIVCIACSGWMMIRESDISEGVCRIGWALTFPEKGLAVTWLCQARRGTHVVTLSTACLSTARVHTIMGVHRMLLLRTICLSLSLA